MTVKERTKMNLKEAFWKIYKNKAVNKISIKEITEAAGYNRGTFYNYYKDVHDMFEEIKQSLMPSEEVIAGMLTAVKNEDWDKIIDFKEAVEDPGNREKILMLFGQNGDPDFIHEYKKDIRLKILNQVGGLNRAEKLRLEYVLEFMLTGLLSVAMLWSENEEDMTEAELEKLMSELTERGSKHVLTGILNKD